MNELQRDPDFISASGNGLLVGVASTGLCALLSTSGAATGDVPKVQADGTIAYEAESGGGASSLEDLSEWDEINGKLEVAGDITVTQSITNATGDLHLSVDGASGPRVTLTGEFSSNQGVTDGEVFGDGGVVSGSFGVGIGHEVNAGERSFAAGWKAKGISRDICIGHAAIAVSSTGRNVLIGYNVNAGANTYWSTVVGYEAGGNVNGSNAFGYGSAPTATGQFVSGSTVVPITDVYFGCGVVHATPVDVTIHGTGGSGTDVSGGDIILAGGRGTGAGAGGSVKLQTAAAGTSGTSLNTLATHVEVTSAGGIGFHGATPTVQSAHIADVPTAGSATAADNATAINEIIAVLEAKGLTATS